MGGTIDNCKNHGKVSGESSVGGIVGAVLENAILKNSQNIGDIMGTDASSTGGVCGWLDGFGTYENNTNGGTVNGVAGTEANARCV